MRFIVALLILAGVGSTYAQSPTRELALGVDNDYPFMTDQYYTAGMDVSYRFLVQSKIPLIHSPDSSKTIFSFHAGIKLFTPKNVDTRDTRYMDRPYCGWNFVNAEFLNFRRKNAGNSFAIQVGVVGHETGMGQLQQWLHKTINLYSIEGWDSQISNEFVVNANVNHTHGFQVRKGVEIVLSSGAWVGTGTNKISQEFTVRLFRFNPLSQSSYMNASLSNVSSRKGKPELFFYASMGGDYVLSNIFIQGSLFQNHRSTFTTSLNPWLFSQRIGIQYASNRISVGLACIHLSKETTRVSVHNYASASIAYRF